MRSAGVTTELGRQDGAAVSLPFVRTLALLPSEPATRLPTGIPGTPECHRLHALNLIPVKQDPGRQKAEQVPGGSCSAGLGTPGPHQVALSSCVPFMVGISSFGDTASSQPSRRPGWQLST